MSVYLAPEEYFERHYLADFAVFGNKMMCGWTLGDNMGPSKRVRFHGIAEFVVCQFQLNLLNQAIYTHSMPIYWTWRAISVSFADPRLCHSGHGMVSHMPYSILRFAQQPSFGIPPIALNWDILRSYSAFFFGDYLRRFRLGDRGRRFSEESFLRAVTADHDCTACVLLSDSWESKHVLELVEYER